VINIPKGTKDVLPQDSHKWQYIEAKAREICRLYNLKEIRTPSFEHTELFLRGIGETSDIVGKEMYTFLDKGGRSITLKPEGTAPVARSYIENALDSLSLPLKMYYFTPVFRYERPQAGRLRQHHQFGVEIYGDPTSYADGETIEIAHSFLTSVGLRNFELNINSIGCDDCRPKYIDALKSYLGGREENMCGVCRDRFVRNPLRILDCKEDGCRFIVANAPLITDYLCDNCAAHFSDLQQNLKARNIEYKKNPWIVRGLDYYTGAVFEFVSNELGAQGTVCGGGRYDKLIKDIGGKDTPCIGFGLGLERLLMLVAAAGVEITSPKLDYFVAVQSPTAKNFCLDLVRKLRGGGFAADTDNLSRSLKAQLRYAEKQNAEYVIVVGESEIQSGEVMIKRLSDGVEKQINIKDLIISNMITR